MYVTVDTQALSLFLVCVTRVRFAEGELLLIDKDHVSESAILVIFSM
jgi:hypothetical protein